MDGLCWCSKPPTVGLCHGQFCANPEGTGMEYDKEVDVIREANQLDLLTCPYIFNVNEA